MNLEGTSIIGWSRGSTGGKRLLAGRAATGETVPPEFHAATDAEVELAARLAAEAFPVYRRWSGKQRAALLRGVAEALEREAAGIIERAHLETALPVARLQGELARTCWQLRLYGGSVGEGSWLDARIDHADPERKPLPKPDVRSMLVPLGPVVVFSASNFPFAYSVAGGDTASALAAGCPVIVKAHEGHPGTSEMVGLVVREAMRAAGAPEGIFSMLQGLGKEVGVALVRHPVVQAVGFTGSRGAGRALMDLAAARPEPIPVYAEMGSVNPVFLLGGALAARAEEMAAGLHASVTLGVGQFCTNPGLVFVETGEAEARFRRKLTELMEASPAGTMLTPGIHEGYRRELEKFKEVEGVRVLAEVSTGEAQAGAALLGTNAATFLKNPELLAEVFGPATLLVECATKEEMLAAARRLDGQLTATVHATEEEWRENGELLAVLETRAGRLVCNGFPTGVEVGPAMQHGGPYPATGDGRTTSVGTRAIGRFARPVCFQNFPEAALPEELREGNPLGIWRMVDGEFGKQ